MAWRTTIKTFISDMVLEAIPDIKYLGPWNNQKGEFLNEETRPDLGVYFEYSLIGDGIEYLLSRDMQQAERIPVEVTLHIAFDCYNESFQDRAYDYADKLTCEIVGKKHELIHGRILKVSEMEDIQHNAAYFYKISFAFQIKEAVFLDEPPTDANPETEESPNPETGRRLKEVVTGVILKK